ncbi:histidine kinase [Aquimarina sp. MMG015]|uniref:histidine kinase n=1 Tax=Aquimarina sp. MMG015 TaxID=2822689 RepID=UPI001B3A400B|nr:histidine kinase [Aquimarina sp. MMG015]MBQ4805656.1 histidine kinase [Aquimarina sp. MMG015]
MRNLTEIKKMDYKIIFILLILIISTAHAQDKVYSQEDIINFEILPNTIGKQEEYKKMLQTDTSLIGWVYYYTKKSYYHLAEQQDDSVLHYSALGIQKYNEMQEVPDYEAKHLKNILIYRSYALNHQKKYKESLSVLLRALDESKKLPKYQPKSNAYILAMLASNHIKMGNKKRALKYRLEIAKDSLFMSTPTNAASCYNRIALLLKETQQKDSVLYYYKRSLQKRLLTNDSLIIAGTYGNIGDYFRKEQLEDSAIYYFEKAKSIYDINLKKDARFHTHLFITSYNGYLLLKKNETKEAIKTFTKVLDSTATFSKIDIEIKRLNTMTSEFLREAYIKNDKYEKALDITVKEIKTLEEYHEQILEEKLNELSIAYESKEKDKSIKSLTEISKEKDIVIQERTLFIIIAIILIILIVGFGLLFFINRKLKNKYRIINLEQRLLRLQLNPHFIFNSLSTVSNLAENKSKKTTTYITKLGDLIALTLKNSREEFISLNDEIKFITNYLELQSDFSKKFNHEINIDEGSENINEIYIPPMFIQPFIENSIEHGLTSIENGLINIAFKINKINNILEIKVKDNGIGIKKHDELKKSLNNNYDSLSSKIIKERLDIYSKLLNKEARFTIKTGDYGTEVLLCIPFILDH